jgi:hypothetical protein
MHAADRTLHVHLPIEGLAGVLGYCFCSEGSLKPAIDFVSQ